MLQTNLIAPGHADLVTYATYDFYGERLATCSADLKVKLFRKSIDAWEPEAEWKAHDAPVLHLSFAHPIQGSLLASCSHDRTVRVWEEPSSSSTSSSAANSAPITPGQQPGPAAQQAAPSTVCVLGGPSGSRWVERAVLSGAKGSVRAVEFSPPNPSYGLRLASISTDSHLRIHASLDPDLSDWSLAHDIHIPTLPAPGSSDDPTAPAGTPVTLSAADGQAGSANEMAMGAWGISWCKEKWWGSVVAVFTGLNPTVKIVSLDPTPTTLLHLTPSSSSPLTSVAWAPSCGRSYHLIATGSRDGSVRIWRVEPPSSDAGDREGWKAEVDAEFPKGPRIGMVAWNATGTTLTTSDDEGVIRIYKATYAKAWKLLGKMSAEEPPSEDTA